MERRAVGTTDLEFSVIGLGTWAIGGGDNPYGWGPQDDRDSIATIHKALDLGVNWIDTAKGYGHGHSEDVVGRAVHGVRSNVYIATKCGILWKEDGSDIYGHLKYDSIKHEVETSLQRLRTEYIDLLQIHWPLPDEDIEEGWRAVSDLVTEGKVRFGGVSNFSVQQLKRIHDINPVASLQPPYNLIDRAAESELLGYCKDHHIGVVAYSPMKSGLLTGNFTRERVAGLPDDDWRKGSSDFTEPMLSIHLDFVDGLREIASKYEESVANLAIAWVLCRPEITSAIVGSRRPEQIQETVRSAELALRGEDLEAIQRLIDEHDRRAAAVQQEDA